MERDSESRTKASNCRTVMGIEERVSVSSSYKKLIDSEQVIDSTNKGWCRAGVVKNSDDESKRKTRKRRSYLLSSISSNLNEMVCELFGCSGRESRTASPALVE